MKIQAKIPFTYLYPEEEPSETYYWVKETVTTEYDGEAYNEALLSENAKIAIKIAAVHESALTVEVNGETYENLTPDQYGGYGDITFAEYPFYFGAYDYAYISTPTAGEYSLNILAEDVVAIDLSIAGAVGADLLLNFAEGTMNAEVATNGSKSAKVVLNGVFVSRQGETNGDFSTPSYITLDNKKYNIFELSEYKSPAAVEFGIII